MTVKPAHYTALQEIELIDKLLVDALHVKKRLVRNYGCTKKVDGEINALLERRLLLQLRKPDDPTA